MKSRCQKHCDKVEDSRQGSKARSSDKKQCYKVYFYQNLETHFLAKRVSAPHFEELSCFQTGNFSFVLREDVLGEVY